MYVCLGTADDTEQFLPGFKLCTISLNEFIFFCYHHQRISYTFKEKTDLECMKHERALIDCATSVFFWLPYSTKFVLKNSKKHTLPTIKQ